MEDIRDKIIQIIIENKRMKLINMIELTKFITENFEDVKGHRKKEDIIEIAIKYLKPDTLNKFNSLPEFGLVQKDLEEVLNIGKTKVKKLVDNKEIKIKKDLEVKSYGSNIKIHYYICDIKDVIDIYNSHTLIPKKTYLYKDLEESDDNLGKALYLVNKSAKVSRDTKNNSYYNKKFGVCKSSKTRMLKHYQLKDEVMEKLFKEGRMQFLGYNRQVFNDGDEQWLKLYKIGDFTFHTPCHFLEKIDPDKVLNEIDGLISSEKKVKVDINYKDAVHLLEKYIGHNN